MTHIEFASRFLLLWSWQAVIVLGAASLIRLLDRSRSPALRYRLWLAGLAVVSVLPVCNTVRPLLPAAKSGSSTAPVAMVRLTATPLSSEFLSKSSEHAPAPDKIFASQDQAGWVLLFGAWLTGFCVCLIRLGLSYRTLQRLRRTAAPVEWPRALGHSPRAVLAISAEVDGPLVAGVRRPIIVLPARMADWTTEGERVAVIRHELAHIQRRDPFVNLFQNLLGAIFFFHPAIRYALQQLSLERELACDCDVVDSGCNAEAYANTILKVAQRAVDGRERQQPAFNPSRKILERRLHMIIENRMPISKTRRIMVLARALVMLGAVTWLLLPQPVATAERERTRMPASSTAPSETWSGGVQLAGEVHTPPPPAPQNPTRVAVSGAIRRLEAPARLPEMHEPLVEAKAAEQALLAGRLFGSISDPSGALVPGAKITLTKDSGIEQSMFSNLEGAFELSQLQPGFYTLLVTIPGFQNFKLTSIRIGEGESREVNVNLHVGAIVQHVEVSVPRTPAAPPASQPAPIRKRISSGVITGSLVSRPELIYPPAARAQGRTGVVVVEIIIGTDGTVTEARVVGRPDSDFAEAALQNVRQWRYRPTMLNNEPVETVATVEVYFRIQ